MRPVLAQKILRHRRASVIDVKFDDGKRLALRTFVRRFIIKKTHFACRKIQLKAIMPQCVVTENADNARTGAILQLPKIISLRLTWRPQRHASQKKPGHGINVAFLFMAPADDRDVAEAFTQFGFNRFIKQRSGRSCVQEEGKGITVRRVECHDNPATAPGAFIDGNFRR